MPLNKIEDAQLLGKGVCGQPDIPGLSAAEMQYKVEQIVREVVIPAFNANVEAQQEENAARYTKAETEEAIQKQVVASGAGDMARSVYDPHGLKRDIFAAVPGADILDNSDFIDPVNQRGAKKCTQVNCHWLDRWRTGPNPITCEWFSGGYIKMDGDGTAYITQRIEEAAIKPERSYTVSIWEWNASSPITGTGVTVGATDSENSSAVILENDKYRCLLVQSASSKNWFFHLYCKQETCRIVRVKLEAGSRATAYPEKSYNERLLECQRYYRKLPPRSLRGAAFSATTAELTALLVPAMRTAPSVTAAGLTLKDGSNVVEATRIDNTNTTADLLRLGVTCTGLTTHRAYTNDAAVELSAEL